LYSFIISFKKGGDNMNEFKCPHCNKVIDKSYLASHMGRIGGDKLKQTRTKEEWKRLSKMALEKRWGNKPTKDSKKPTE
jgi:hypothetical protein